MSGRDWHRRAVLTGMAASAAAAAGAARAAQTEALPLARGELAGNPVARLFKAAPAGLKLPASLKVAGLSGSHPLSSYAGRVLLVSLWAEWCTPCLVEMPDLARLQRSSGSARFQILPIMSGSRKKMGPEVAGQLLTKLGAGTFAPVMEPRGGSRLLETLAVSPQTGKPTLPANLLVDSSGRVVARQFGFVAAHEASGQAEAKSKRLSWNKLTVRDKRELLARSAAGEEKGVWSTPAAAGFAAALAAGFLDRR